MHTPVQLDTQNEAAMSQAILKCTFIKRANAPYLAINCITRYLRTLKPRQLVNAGFFDEFSNTGYSGTGFDFKQWFSTSP